MQAMKASVYVETTIFGYLVGRPSRDLIVAAHQRSTAEWWTKRRGAFRLHVSELVIAEAGVGDRSAARRRLDAIEGAAILNSSPAALELAEALVREKAVPAKAAADATHIAIAAVHEMNYLLTWNCRHIANASKRRAIEDAIRSRGFRPPAVCTPEELMGTPK
jgi:hypothetical protein